MNGIGSGTECAHLTQITAKFAVVVERNNQRNPMDEIKELPLPPLPEHSPNEIITELQRRIAKMMSFHIPQTDPIRSSVVETRLRIAEYYRRLAK